MRALGGVTISPSVKRYIYLVDGKKSPLLLLKRVKTKGGERRSNSLLRDNKNESESLDYLYEYTLHFGFDLRVARAKDAARIYFFFAHVHLHTSICRSYDIGRVTAARSRAHRAQQKAPVDTSDRWRPGRLSE